MAILNVFFLVKIRGDLSGLEALALCHPFDAWWVHRSCFVTTLFCKNKYTNLDTPFLLFKVSNNIGAKAIYLVIACPPIVNVCNFGINIPTQNELLAAKRSKEQIKEVLKVDELVYPSIKDLLTSITKSSHCTPCVQCMKVDLSADIHCH